MEKVFIFKNRGTAQVKNVRASDTKVKTAIQWAIHFVVEVLEWKPEDVIFINSRKADHFMDFPKGGRP